MGNKLSTTPRAVLSALTQLGTADLAEIQAAAKKGPALIQQGIADLIKAGLITQIDPDDADGVTRWKVTDTSQPSDPTEAPDTTAETSGDTADQTPDTAPDATAESSIDATDETADMAPDADTGASPADASDEQNEDSTEAADNQAIDDQAQAGTEAGSPAPAAPAAEPPKRFADRKVLAIRGVLAEYDDGATLEDLSQETGYPMPTVSRLLGAMEKNQSAIYLAPDKEKKLPPRWKAGPGKASEVDPNPEPPRCPTCNQTIKGSTPKSAQNTPGSIRPVNSGGHEPFKPGELKTLVLKFINSRPGHEFTATMIATELGTQLGREVSSGAVGNNLNSMALDGAIRQTSTTPRKFSALESTPTAAAPDQSTQDDSGEQTGDDAPGESTAAQDEIAGSDSTEQ